MSITSEVRRSDGTLAGRVELSVELFGVVPNVPVMHQVVVAQLAAARAGTHSTKTRSKVRGGGAKPWRQKGTGRARQGSTRAPHWTGGGVVFGPTPRDYTQRTPKKMKRLALRSALSDRAAEGRVVIVELDLESPRTKAARSSLTAMECSGRILLVVAEADEMVALSFRNLPECQTTAVGELSTYDVLRSDWVVFTPASLAVVEGKESLDVDRSDAEEPAPPVEEESPEEKARARRGRRRAVRESEAEEAIEAEESLEDDQAAGAEEAGDEPADEAGDSEEGEADEVDEDGEG